MARTIEETLADQITSLREELKDLSARAEKQTNSAWEGTEYAFSSAKEAVSDFAAEARDQGQKAVRYTRDNPGTISVWAAVGVAAAIAYFLLKRR